MAFDDGLRRDEELHLSSPKSRDERGVELIQVCCARLIISDVDGTITRSDILGHVLPRVGLDWSHFGINRLFTNIRANGYEIMFLSSRAIAQVRGVQ